MVTYRVRRKHRWWKRALTLDGRISLGMIPLILLTVAAIGVLVLWFGN